LYFQSKPARINQDLAKGDAHVTSTSAIDQLAVSELCELSVGFDQFQTFPTALGTRLIAVARGGRVEGRLEGEVLPGGGDWLMFGADGIARMDVRASIRTTDGEMLYMTGLGRAEIVDGARDRFLAGDTMTSADVRSRLALMFEAGAGEYAWLNATVAVGMVTELSQRHIHYRVHAVA
jgi:Protein of unknown function (DUF3237)